MKASVTGADLAQMPEQQFKDAAEYMRRASTEPLLTQEQLAERFGLTVRTVARWTKQGRLPCYRLGGKFVRYSMGEVLGWLHVKANAQPPRMPEAIEQAPAALKRETRRVL